MTREETIIEPTYGRFSIDLRGMAQYRDLRWLVIPREISAKFRQTLLGPAWFLIQPTFTAAMYWFAFQRVAAVSVGEIPPVLFYFSSVALWGYFSQTCSGVSEALNHHAHLMTKVHFPRLIIPMSIVGWRLIPLTLQFAAIGALYWIISFFGPLNVEPSVTAFLILPFLILFTGVFAMGVGLFIAACTVRFRDLHHLFALTLQLWMFATPVVYPLSSVPQPYRNWFVLNPLSAIFEAYRWILFGVPMNLNLMAVSIGMVLVIFSIGLYAFQRVERTFVDTI